MKQTLIILCTVLVMLTAGTISVSADNGCQPIYGGGETCTTSDLAVDKTVFNPQSTNVNDPSAFVNNLGSNDAKYKAGFNVTFHIKVTNTMNAPLNKIQVKDVFPQVLQFVADFSPKPGSFNQNNSTWTATIDNLKQNESITYTLVGRVVAENQLPKDQTITCATNQATATTSDNKTVTDTAQFCIQRQAVSTSGNQTKGGLPLSETLPVSPTQTTKGGLPVLSPQPVKTTPSTGPEALPLLALIPTGAIGIYLRKLAGKK